MACTQVNLYQAKTQLSSLVDRAARGEEIIVAKAGEPVARLTPLAVVTALEPERLPFGKNLPGITFLSVDWEDDLPPEFWDNPEKGIRPCSGLREVTEPSYLPDSNILIWLDSINERLTLPYEKRSATTMRDSQVERPHGS